MKREVPAMVQRESFTGTSRFTRVFAVVNKFVTHDKA